MWLEIVLIIVCFAVVLWGADRFTDGACGLARRLNVSELVIGLTVVSLGTSLPEFIVSFMSILRGSGDMSVGNVMGSNIFNILVITGASALMRNIKVDGSMLHRHFPICFLASFLLFNFAYSEGEITRWEGFLLAAFFCVYIYYNYHVAMKAKKNAQAVQPPSEGETASDDMSLLKSLGLIVVGMAALVIGGRVLVDNAASLAREIGISESVIGMTILAGGTSLPELATSVIAARKGSFGLALGNVVGSNIFNIAFVVGFCSSFVPMAVTQITLVDWAVFVGSVVFVWVLAKTGRKLDKREGIVLVSCYLAYLISLIMG